MLHGSAQRVAACSTVQARQPSRQVQAALHTAANSLRRNPTAPSAVPCCSAAGPALEISSPARKSGVRAPLQEVHADAIYQQQRRQADPPVGNVRRALV